MIKNNARHMMFLALSALLLASLSCTFFTTSRARIGPLQTDSQTIVLGDDESVRVEIAMASGVLEVNGGAADLMDADLTYNVEELQPEVSYSGGTLSIQTPDVELGVGSLRDIDDLRYEWDLRFNDEVPMEMRIDLGAGMADLDLRGLSLTRFDLNSGAGDIRVNLSGAASLTRLDVQLGAGQAIIDLSGVWQNDLDAVIQTGVGQLTLRLPRETGVRVDAEGGIANITASGLSMEGGSYVNEAYGESPVTLRIDIEAGIGAIDLELGE